MLLIIHTLPTNIIVISMDVSLNVEDFAIRKMCNDSKRIAAKIVFCRVNPILFVLNQIISESNFRLIFSFVFSFYWKEHMPSKWILTKTKTVIELINNKTGMAIKNSFQLKLLPQLIHFPLTHLFLQFPRYPEKIAHGHVPTTVPSIEWLGFIH